MARPPQIPQPSRLAQSAYMSPYSHSGAPASHPNADSHASTDTDLYAPLRASALASLEAMGFDGRTMAERGVVWAEDQDPFGHVAHSQYMHFFGLVFHRVMESYTEYFDEDEYDGMVKGRTVIPVVRKYELEIRRVVTYPDSLIAANRQERIEPTRSHSTTVLYSLKQQAIVAQVIGNVTFMDVKTSRPVDIRTLGGGWTKLYEGFARRAETARGLRVKWEESELKRKGKAKGKEEKGGGVGRDRGSRL
ncbi:putative thioesterase [Lophiostoma macrostomum CBS 122681]|uniref:Putative thioesterase n=1 Tax=Lophiostoma macrostomum CBS 122681 TaxID=1314788 RepID=A0A6A6SN50_9PLEO|nr:putative thioesterase [Lophiostoma macrostomum CBS 122681]